MTQTNELTRANGQSAQIAPTPNGTLMASRAQDAAANADNVMDAVIGTGDIARLSPEQRIAYYNNVCKSLGLNPLTKPFEYVTLQGKMSLYATRGCTDQLRSINRVSITHIEREVRDGIYMVTATAQTPDGRTDSSTGALVIENLRGEALANAYMKAETKAKRRVTLSIVGLGWLDESELDTVPHARTGVVDVVTGEITEPPRAMRGLDADTRVPREQPRRMEGPPAQQQKAAPVATGAGTCEACAAPMTQGQVTTIEKQFEGAHLCMICRKDPARAMRLIRDTKAMDMPVGELARNQRDIDMDAAQREEAEHAHADAQQQAEGDGPFPPEEDPFTDGQGGRL